MSKLTSTLSQPEHAVQTDSQPQSKEVSSHSIEIGLWKRLPWIVDSFNAQQLTKIAIYGNGSHTERLYSVWQKLQGPDITAILVSGEPSTSVIEGVPVIPIQSACDNDIEAIVLSSHRYEIAMSIQCKEFLPHTPVFFVHNSHQVNTHLLSQHMITEFLADECFYIIDGGAIDMVSENIDEFWPAIPKENMQVFAFEPDEKECETIERTAREIGYAIQAFPYGLWDTVTNKTLYLTHNRTGSSFFKPNIKRLSQYYYCQQPFAQQMGVANEVAVGVTTLDTLWNARVIEQLDFVKLNIEGAEKNVIEGGQQALSQVLGIQLEMGFNEKVEGGPLFADIDPILRDMGFELFDVLSLNRYSRIESNVDFDDHPLLIHSHSGNAPNLTKQVFEGHFIYFRSTYDWDALLAIFGDTIVTKLLKLACLQEMYGHLEAAFATLHLLANHLADTDIQPRLNQAIRSIEQQCFRQGLKQRQHHYNPKPVIST